MRTISGSMLLVSTLRMVQMSVGMAFPSTAKAITSLLFSLYFVRSGYIDVDNDAFKAASRVGRMWSSSARSKIDNGSKIPSAYYLPFDSSVGLDWGPFYRWFGFPLRCLISGGGIHANADRVQWKDKLQ